MPSGWDQGSRMEAPAEALSRLSGLSLRTVVSVGLMPRASHSSPKTRLDNDDDTEVISLQFACSELVCDNMHLQGSSTSHDIAYISDDAKLTAVKRIFCQLLALGSEVLADQLVFTSPT